MKKMISLLLSLVLALSLTPAVFAEETDPAEEEAGVPSVYWGDLVPVIKDMGLAGDYYTMEGSDVIYWLPAALKPVDPEEFGGFPEDSDILAAFQTDNGYWGLLITLYDLECEDIEDFAGRVSQLEGAEKGEFILINDLAAYSFVYDEELYVSFCTEEGSIFSFQFYPADNYVYSAIARMIAASVQEYQEDSSSAGD